MVLQIRVMMELCPMLIKSIVKNPNKLKYNIMYSSCTGTLIVFHIKHIFACKGVIKIYIYSCFWVIGEI